MSGNGQSPEDPNYQARLSAMLAAAKEKADTLAAAAENKYSSMVEQGQKLADQAQAKFNGAMQDVQQGMGELQNKVKEGLQDLQQKAIDAKGTFDREVQNSLEFIQGAKAEMQQGLASAAQQGQELAAKAADAAKQGVEATQEYLKSMAAPAVKESVKQAALYGIEHGVGAATDGETGKAARDFAEKGYEWAKAGGVELVKGQMIIMQGQAEELKAKAGELLGGNKDAATSSPPEKFKESGQPSSDVEKLKSAGSQGEGADAPKPNAPDPGIDKSKFAGLQSNGADQSTPAAPEPGIDQSKFAKKGPEHSAFMSPELVEKYRQRQADLKQSSDGSQSPAQPAQSPEQPKAPAAAPVEVPAPTPTQVTAPSPAQVPAAAPTTPSTPVPPSAPAPPAAPTVPPPSMKM
ncbi:MAG TPA: hypothetical protein VN859_04040 [Steroidobacteraceae bacterium]|nr:hypothetical protein [Steroidobacteraceae bacterium]